MQASDAARIFHDWVFGEGLMPDGPAASPVSTRAELALIQPITEKGRQILRSKQVMSIAFAQTRGEIFVFTKRAAPVSKKMIASLPTKIDDIAVQYRQGAETPIGTVPTVAFGGPPYLVRQTGTAQRYTLWQFNFCWEFSRCWNIGVPSPQCSRYIARIVKQSCFRRLQFRWRGLADTCAGNRRRHA